MYVTLSYELLIIFVKATYVCIVAVSGSSYDLGNNDPLEFHGFSRLPYLSFRISESTISFSRKQAWGKRGKHNPWDL